MAAYPIALHPSPLGARSLLPNWFHAALGIAFVACTSTSFMGGSHTQILVDAVWKAIFGHWHMNAAGTLNLALRKTGHFFGHGLLSLLFFRAWYRSMRRAASIPRAWWVPAAAALAVLTTFAVASLDEWHQTFLPGRVGCFRDVLIDTAGAIALNTAFCTLRARLRRRPRSFSRNAIVNASAA